MKRILKVRRWLSLLVPIFALCFPVTIIKSASHQTSRPVIRPFARWTTHNLCTDQYLPSFSFQQYSEVIDEYGSTTHKEPLPDNNEEITGWEASMTCIGASLRQDIHQGINKDHVNTYTNDNELDSFLNTYQLEMLWYVEANHTTRLLQYDIETNTSIIHCTDGFQLQWSPQIIIEFYTAMYTAESTAPDAPSEEKTTNSGRRGLKGQAIESFVRQEFTLTNCQWEQGKYYNETYRNVYIICSFANEMEFIKDVKNTKEINIRIMDASIDLQAEIKLCQLDPNRKIQKFAVCSAPLFDVDMMEAKWGGIVEQWVLYHHSVLGLGRYANNNQHNKLHLYDVDGSLKKYIQRLLDLGYVDYVSEFAVSEDARRRQVEGGALYTYCSQVHAENHCLWKTRGHAEYTLKIHSVDAYLKAMDVDMMELSHYLDQSVFDSKLRIGAIVTLLYEVYQDSIDGLFPSNFRDADARGSSNIKHHHAKDMFSIFRHPLDKALLVGEPVVDPHLLPSLIVHKPIRLQLFPALETVALTDSVLMMHFTNLFRNRKKIKAVAVVDQALVYNATVEMDPKVTAMELTAYVEQLKKIFELKWKEYQWEVQLQSLLN